MIGLSCTGGGLRGGVFGSSSDDMTIVSTTICIGFGREGFGLISGCRLVGLDVEAFATCLLGWFVLGGQTINIFSADFVVGLGAGVLLADLSDRLADEDRLIGLEIKLVIGRQTVVAPLTGW